MISRNELFKLVQKNLPEAKGHFRLILIEKILATAAVEKMTKQQVVELIENRLQVDRLEVFTSDRDWILEGELTGDLDKDIELISNTILRDKYDLYLYSDTQIAYVEK